MKTKFYDEFVAATDGKFPMLKLNGALFDKRANSLTVKFIISAFEISGFSEENKAEVLKTVQSLFPGISVEVQYIRTYADNAVVKNRILEYLNTNNQMLFRSLTDEHLKITVDDKDISVVLRLETPVYKMFTAGNLQDGLTDWLDRNFNQNIELSAEEVASSDKDGGFKLSISNTASTDISSLRLIEIEDGEKIFSRGRVAGITQMPNYIADVKGESDNLIICGKVSNLSKRTYKNKKYNPEDSKTGPAELPLMRFMLDDTTGKMDCVCFPRPEETEQIESALEQCGQVVCVGKASKYNDTLSYTVSAMFACKINFDSIKTSVSKPVPEYYNTVIPEDCVSMEQQSLLDGGTAEVNKYFKGKTFVIFDLETTSKMVDSAHIVQISALKVVDGVEKQRFDTFVKPPISIPAEVIEIHHIDDDTVADAPKIQEVMPDFFKFTRGAVLVGHNIIGYDFAIINRIASAEGYIFDNELLDTLALARKYMPEMSNHKLTTLSKALKIEHENAHRADSDVFATWGVLKEAVRRM